MEQVRRLVEEAQELLRQALAALPPEEPELEAGRTIHWGQKVSPKFKAGVIWIEETLGVDADHLMDCMAFETGATFSPKVKNLAGSSGLGLIQFMKTTHKNMLKFRPALAEVAPTHASLAKLTAEQQLSFVFWYFRMFGDDFSSYTLEDIYMMILYPAAVGKPNDWAMPWRYGELAYRQNSGLDLNKDRQITKAEAGAGVRRMALLGEQQKG